MPGDEISTTLLRLLPRDETAQASLQFSSSSSEDEVLLGKDQERRLLINSLLTEIMLITPLLFVSWPTPLWSLSTPSISPPYRSVLLVSVSLYFLSWLVLAASILFPLGLITPSGKKSVGFLRKAIAQFLLFSLSYFQRPTLTKLLSHFHSISFMVGMETSNHDPKGSKLMIAGLSRRKFSLDRILRGVGSRVRFTSDNTVVSMGHGCI